MSYMKVEEIGFIDKLIHVYMTFLTKIITRTNIWLLQKSNGRLGNSFLGRKVLLLHSIGFKSGQLRKTPLFYLSDGDTIILVASNGGTITDPAWLKNLKASPLTKVNINGQEIAVNAHTAEEEEFQHYWPKVVEMFPVWEKIQGKSVRNFPLVVLEPIGNEPSS